MRGEYGDSGEFYPENTDCEAPGMCRYPEPYQDNHHIFYEARDYQTSVERKFRNLGCNMIEICRCKHDEIHALEEKPDKPEVADMIEAIEYSEEHISRSVRKAIKRYRSE